MGTEIGLGTVPNIDIEKMFPYLPDLAMFEGTGVPGAPEAEHAPGPDSTLTGRFFKHALIVPGVLHTLHNATHDITNNMISFDVFYTLHKQFCCFMKYKRERLVATCFAQ